LLHFSTFEVTVCFDKFADERVSLDVGKIIQKGRMDKKMSQKDLATV
jgi:ribosome-binding protein aMBF1 (putative translation factor)